MEKVKSAPTKHKAERARIFPLDEANMLYVYPSLAMNIGFNEALVAHRLYCLTYDSEKTIGQWIMFSTKQWEEEFPFWSKSTIQRTFQSLKDGGIITSRKLNKQEIVSMLCEKTPQRLNTDLDFYVCDWCKGETFILNEHHYPVPKESGGERVVKVCPNCHYEFHSLETLTLYSLDKKMIDDFDEVEVDNNGSNR